MTPDPKKSGAGKTDDFRVRFRYEVAVLGVVVCGVFVYVAYLESGPGKIFFAGFAALMAFILLSTLRREQSLLRGNAVARGTVLYFRRNERGRGRNFPSQLKYMFDTPDGETYEKLSEIVTPRTLLEDAPILVLYKPSDPEESQASTGFMFYRFRKMLRRL